MSEIEMPNQNSGYSERYTDYLKRAADACASGDLVLGMHLYLAAYEKAVADPEIPDGMALSGLREAWHLACELKERSMAEYVFEKLEPYLTGEEIAACASKLQSLALDRLEEYGFSREELEDMAEMISQDLGGGESSVVKVESISIPNVGMFGVPTYQQNFTVDASAQTESPDPSGAVLPSAQGGADVGDVVAGDAQTAGDEPAGREGDRPEADGSHKPSEVGMGVAKVDDFNPYDMYRDYSIGKSYHAATNEGSGAAVFTRDEERQRAHDDYEAGKIAGAALASAEATPSQAAQPAAEVVAQPDVPGESAGESSSSELSIAQQGQEDRSIANSEDADLPAMPEVGQVGATTFNYRGLAGYGDAIAVMRDLGVGLQNDRGFQGFVAMLNERHGLDRAPALDTLLFRAPVIEDAARFAEATIGELGLPALRMSMEEGVQGVPVLCVMAQGNHRPRMNHSHNRFEAPAILVLEDLDTWVMPEPPENAEGIAGFVMANISRGAREAVNLIRSAVEDPDVYVLATATTTGEVDPFFYELLEPLTVIDIGLPNDQERSELWTEIARDHPSMRTISRPDLMRFSHGLARYDIYMAARDAIEEAYKLGLVQRSFVPVTPQNIFEKLAACQPLESEEYRALENEVIRNFQRDLEHLEDLVDGAQE